MADPSYEHVPATPISVLSNVPPKTNQVNFAIGLENPINTESVKVFFSKSIMLKIPRFSSLLVVNETNPNLQYWRRTRVEIDQHFFIIRHDQVADADEVAEDSVNAYLAELATAPSMNPDKPLWEVHVLIDLNFLVLRIHHAIGDGASLASLLWEIGGGVGRKRQIISRPPRWRASGRVFKYAWFSMVFCVDLLLKLMLFGDKKTVFTAKDYVQDWPQKIATARFNLDDLNLIKKVVPNATVNDIMSGIIWGGFLKYLNYTHSSTATNLKPLKEGQQITGVLMANLRERPGLVEISKLIEEKSLESWWGNKVGFFLLPMYYTKKVANPTDYVRKAKFILDKKKKSIEPHFGAALRNLGLRVKGVKEMSHSINKSGSKVTFAFSNVMGPPEHISIAGNRVKYLRFSTSSTPVATSMTLVSYANHLDLQILVAEDVIPDPKFLASCFKDTLQEMKDMVNRPSV